MTDFHPITRRRALRTLFCSSAALSLNLRAADDAPSAGQPDLDFLCIGDFGTGSKDQQRVAAAMAAMAKQHNRKPDALWLLGDNFYDRDRSPGGFSVTSPRWKSVIEDMYPADVFPGPMHAVLGNHDYHDNAGGQNIQLAYARQNGIRWHMPAKWYRVDAGGKDPLVTFLCLDSNLPEVSGGKNKKAGTERSSLSQTEADAQLAWIKSELAKPRAPFTIVVAHHPIYSNGEHGDTEALVRQWDKLFQEHRVHAYLCGHDHDLQHLELEGRFTSYVLSGGGGASSRKLKETHKDCFGASRHGFTRLTVTRDALGFSHHTADGKTLHRFSKARDGKVTIGA